MKKILAETLVLALLMTVIPVALAENKEATVEPTEETTQAPAEEIGEDDQLVAVIEDEKDANRSVSIYASYEGNTVSYGDTLTLKAQLKGYEGVKYTLQWQVSTDNSTWKNIPGETGMTYSIVVTEENVNNYYRIAVTTD